MSDEMPPVANADEVAGWSDEVDVVVVGLGIAGGCAALEAARAGARVLVLERAAVAGGTSAMAGGHFYLGGGTAVQRATGHADSAEQMAAYLRAVSPAPDEAKIVAYCQDSVLHFEWLEELGFAFERSYYPEKAVIQPGTQGLMYTGNELVWPFCEQTRPAPRGHKVPVPGDTGGARLVIDLLVERLAQAGAQVRYETGARHLVTDESGAVVGVGWRSAGHVGAIRASAVVLAAGGFVMNRDMVARHAPLLATKPYVLGSTFDDGLGIRLGMSVGGATEQMDSAFLTAPVYPPVAHLSGIIVNAQGRRFVAEDSYHARTSAAVMEQPEQRAYLIVDEAHLRKHDFELVPFIDGWESIDEMAVGLGLPAAQLRQTISRYSQFAADGVDTELHKASGYLAPLDRGPWAAFDLSLGKASYAGFTLGGLRTSVDGEVCDNSSGMPIRGLYAAGACASGLAQDGKGYASGLQLGDGSYFGRRAGRHAASVARVAAE